MSRLDSALAARFTDLDEIKDVANYGCAGGVSGFIYYHETSEFFDEHEDEIYDVLNDAGYSMKNFVDTGSTITSLKNEMVWCVVEMYCHGVINTQMQDEYEEYARDAALAAA